MNWIQNEIFPYIESVAQNDLEKNPLFKVVKFIEKGSAMTVTKD